jgi:hypothetical protein
LEAKTVEEVKPQFVAGFGNVDLDIEPNEDRKKMSRLKVMTAVCRLRE